MHGLAWQPAQALCTDTDAAPGVDIHAAAVFGALKPLAVIHPAFQVQPLPRRALAVRRASARQAAESKHARRRQREAQGCRDGEQGGGSEAGCAKDSFQHRERARGHVRRQEAAQGECPVGGALSTQEEGAEGLEPEWVSAPALATTNPVAAP